MPPPSVAITTMHRICARPRSDGTRLLATFDAEFCDFKFVGCSLLVDPNGEPHAYPPDARCRTPRGRPIVITNHALRQAMLRKALMVYGAMTEKAGANQ